ncbi:MAG: segregation/condensation protein A [Clostridia bacterium]|nr:segregation/condensation protein A [Clostridia bacterium]
MEPTYHLEGVIQSKEEMADFEGPLNLILMLLSKNKIEIRDIQISLILEQYLAYLDEMKAMDLEIASEFVQMASHLLYIKTRMLLKGDEEEVSELELLMASLEQLRAKDIYNNIKEIAPELLKASEKGALIHVKEPEPLRGVKEYRYSHEPWELLRAMNNVLGRGKTAADEQGENPLRRRIVPKRIVYNVREKSREIIERLRRHGNASLAALYAESRSRSEVVATFVSILELASLGHVRMSKSDDDIMIEFMGGDTDDILKMISE